MMAAIVMEVLLLAVGGLGDPPDSAVFLGDSVVAETDLGSGVDNSMFDQFENESDELQPLDDLTWREEHPYDLNRVSVEELESLPGVTPHEARAVVEFRKAIRKFTRVDQLKLIEDAGDDLHEKLSPYVTAGVRTENVVQFRSRTSRNLQPRQGDLDSSFVGSAIKSYERMSIKGNAIEAGALFEKDAGEKLTGGFASGYVSVKNLGVLSQVVAGDFIVEAAQGLVLWRGTAFGKGGEAISVARKSALSVQPYRSSGEVEYLRGVGTSALVELGDDKIEVTGFISRRILDASLDTSGAVSGFYEAGLFRTQNELQKRKAVTEQIFGGRLQFISSAGWSVGSTAFRSAFDKPVTSTSLYEFNGQRQNIVGVDATITLGRLSAFGEIARSNDQSIAGIVGTIIGIDPETNVALLYRDYGRGFNNLHANGFGERSDTRNERGFYFGVTVRPTKWLKMSGYIDQFRFPWQTYFNPLPTNGHEILFHSDASISRQLDLTVRFSHKSAEGSEADTDVYGRDIRSIAARTQRKYRVTAIYKANSEVTVKGRLEMTTVRYSLTGRHERGFLLFQDLRYRISKHISLDARLVFFDTDSYDSRLYEYENDLRGVFSNPGLYGRGCRWYLVVGYSAGPAVKLSAKYSETQREGVATMGSGVTEIQGPLDNRLSVQVDVNL